MYLTTAGSTLYIGDELNGTPTDMTGWDVKPSQTWVKIEGTEVIGFVGGLWDTLEAGYDLQTGNPQFFKGGKRPSTMQVIIGMLEDDPGQLAVLTAYNSVAPWGFRLVLPDGAERWWNALVVGAGEIFDSANSAIRMQADLQLTSDVVRPS